MDAYFVDAEMQIGQVFPCMDFDCIGLRGLRNPRIIGRPSNVIFSVKAFRGEQIFSGADVAEAATAFTDRSAAVFIANGSSRTCVIST